MVEYQEAVDEMQSALEKALTGFVTWLENNWKMTSEEWSAAFAAPAPSADYFKGYNAAIEGIRGGLATFIEASR